MIVLKSNWSTSTLCLLGGLMLMPVHASCSAPRPGWQSALALQSDGPINVIAIDADATSAISVRSTVSAFYCYRSISATIPMGAHAPRVLRHHSNMPMTTWPAAFVTKGSAFVVDVAALYDLWRGGPTASSDIPQFDQLPAGSKLIIRMEYIESDGWPVRNEQIGNGVPFSIQVSIL